jgi:hypothetical protein
VHTMTDFLRYRLPACLPHKSQFTMSSLYPSVVLLGWLGWITAEEWQWLRCRVRCVAAVVEVGWSQGKGWMGKGTRCLEN